MQKMRTEYADVFTSAEIDKVIDCCRTVDDLMYVYGVGQEFDMPPVLCHGDLHTGNIILGKVIDKDGNEKCGDNVLAFVDWQVKQIVF